MKLKDFPWNGWLRLGIAGKAAAAWNPVGGFSDPAGRLLWAAVGDPAAFPGPVRRRLGAQSGERGGRRGRGIPDDALKPDPSTGHLREVGKGKVAEAQTTYRVGASAFHDGTRMTAADALYPVLLAARASAAKGRDWLAGAKVVRVEAEVKKFADVSFTFITPVIDVYTAGTLDVAERQSALPWSPLPWTVLTLMEEAAVPRLGGGDPRGGDAAPHSVARPRARSEAQDPAGRPRRDLRVAELRAAAPEEAGRRR